MMFVYNFALIGTVGMMLSRCEYFWVGFLVMVALVFLVWLDFFGWMLKWRLGAMKEYKNAIRTNDPEKVEQAERHLKEDSWADVIREPLKRAGMVALIGLVAIPLWIIGKVMDSVKYRRICRKV